MNCKCGWEGPLSTELLGFNPDTMGILVVCPQCGSDLIADLQAKLTEMAEALQRLLHHRPRHLPTAAEEQDEAFARKVLVGATAPGKGK